MNRILTALSIVSLFAAAPAFAKSSAAKPTVAQKAEGGDAKPAEGTKPAKKPSKKTTKKTEEKKSETAPEAAPAK